MFWASFCTITVTIGLKKIIHLMILSVANESEFALHKHCRYKPNDYYLKQLIEQWCEGVILNGNKRKYNFSTRNRTDLGPESMILEKVAEHLQKDSTNSISINLRGLSKVKMVSS